jgi:hypothetical protein
MTKRTVREYRQVDRRLHASVTFKTTRSVTNNLKAPSVADTWRSRELAHESAGVPFIELF